jgi:hypothetical protein
VAAAIYDSDGHVPLVFYGFGSTGGEGALGVGEQDGRVIGRIGNCGLRRWSRAGAEIGADFG